VQQVVQQGGHRWVVIRVVLRAEVLDGEDGIGGDAGPLRHLRGNTNSERLITIWTGEMMGRHQLTWIFRHKPNKRVTKFECWRHCTLVQPRVESNMVQSLVAVLPVMSRGASSMLLEYSEQGIRSLSSTLHTLFIWNRAARSGQVS
jgi:hypothetical protein